MISGWTGRITDIPEDTIQLGHEFASCLEIGDVIFWDSIYCEIDTVAQGQYLFGKNPDTDSLGGTHGASWSVIVDTHEMRRSKINTLENVKAGYDEYISGTKIDEQRGGLYG